jgi:hypothetical protein
MGDHAFSALDEHGNPAPGVILGDDGSITIGSRRVIYPVRLPYKPNVRYDRFLTKGNGFNVAGWFAVPGGVDIGPEGEVSFGGQVILGPKRLSPIDPLKDYGVHVKFNGNVRIGRLYFKRGQRVCLVAAHKAAKQRWSALRAAWVAAVCASA